ncbi:hypothetical protein CRE_10821 [Caenorhabditis remanei]|uniref:RRM domain-containing protein n=1 Tax=Caenorhabditis remanei TaxID=31234 RepID=E3M520_CAERE|nr:hypothetical protein CRE_10821 [Caenorhabditis remanei]
MDAKVYVGGLPSDATSQELEEIFDRFGRIRKVWVARRPPGFAFVEYDDVRDAEDAVRALDGSESAEYELVSNFQPDNVVVVAAVAVVMEVVTAVVETTTGLRSSASPPAIPNFTLFHSSPSSVFTTSSSSLPHHSAPFSSPKIFASELYQPRFIS